MGKNRRLGRGKDGLPQMFIRCVCGVTLATVSRPRYRDGRPKDPLWMIGGLSYNSHYNSNEGRKFEHDHFAKVHTHTFECRYTEFRAPSVMEVPEVIEPDILDEMEAKESLSPLDLLRLKRKAEPDTPEYDELVDQLVAEKARELAQEHYKVNPARYTEAGITQRPRDVKRAGHRCGRVHTVTGKRVLDHWNKLAGIDEEMPFVEAKRRERDAYRSTIKAGKSWVMILGN